MRAVIDTNCLVASISPKSKYNWLYHYFLNEQFEWVLSNEILTEYEEIISIRYNIKVAENVIRILTVAPNSIFVNPYFKWGLIENDLDDNKFADVYLSSNSDVLVTHDRDFNVLKKIDFPKFNISNLDEFKNLLS